MALETAVTPPSSSTISSAVMASYYDKRRKPSIGVTLCGVYACYESRQSSAMLSKLQLLEALERRGIKNVEIERALGLKSSRVTEIRRALKPDARGKVRDLSYDEGVKLVRAFGLEQDQQASPLQLGVVRLAVRHLARRLNAPLSEPLLHDLAEDLRAFSQFVANPTVRGSVEAAEGFFHALEYRNREAPEEAPQGNDRAQTH